MVVEKILSSLQSCTSTAAGTAGPCAFLRPLRHSGPWRPTLWQGRHGYPGRGDQVQRRAATHLWPHPGVPDKAVIPPVRGDLEHIAARWKWFAETQPLLPAPSAFAHTPPRDYKR